MQGERKARVLCMHVRAGSTTLPIPMLKYHRICCDNVENRMNFTPRRTPCCHSLPIEHGTRNIVHAGQYAPIGSPDLHITILLYALRTRHGRLVEPRRIS